MNKGFIQLHRSLLEWEWYDDKNTKILFLHCLLKANYKDKNYRGKTIKRGSFLTGRDVLANELGLSIQQIRTSLTKLKSTNEITIKSSSQGTIIEVVKYNDYQEVTNKATDEQPTNNQRITTTNKSNNIKKSNKGIVLPDWISQDSWDGFVEMRKKIKKPLTDRACTGIINKLDKLGKQNADAILDQSTENCWQTVYELKEQPQQQTGNYFADKLL